ncbi:uncharacterized protein LOC109792723 [Cajanus cajan]|uniref:uncharacterized protein LOC109792723 n=1 Tax=Cajanus cajan TaxID=3821 RepID=UPI00098D8A82|nr:uncharacterized protein LOC109792723 [Cajanus cajan]
MVVHCEFLISHKVEGTGFVFVFGAAVLDGYNHHCFNSGHREHDLVAVCACVWCFCGFVFVFAIAITVLDGDNHHCYNRGNQEHDLVAVCACLWCFCGFFCYWSQMQRREVN